MGSERSILPVAARRTQQIQYSTTPLHYSTTPPVVTIRLVLLLWLAVHFPEWMFVQQIWFDTAKLLTVVDLNSDVIIQRTDRRSLIEKNIFGLVKDL